MRRVNVVGMSGSGKSTVAARAARHLHVPYVELDALHWTRPNWELPPLDEFRARVAQEVRGDSWVIAGNYGKVRDLVWARADTVVWLDLPWWRCNWRVTRRTWRQARRREVLWAGNRESVFSGLLGWDALWLYNLRTLRRRRRTFARAHESDEYRHIEFIRLRSQDAVDVWLGTLTPGMF